MNRAHWTKLLPIIQAFVDGKTIQFHPNYSPSGDFAWKDLPADNATASFDNTVSYRIKPESKLRPWKLDEVPVGATIRTSEGTTALIMQADAAGIKAGHSLLWSPRDALTYCKWRWPIGNQPWQPCGVLETES
jgi:hypothetical protein